MEASLDTRLRESLELLRDPSLAEPRHVPWLIIAIVIAAAILVVLTVVALRLLRRRLQTRPTLPDVVPEPLEDTLAALATAWSQVGPERIIPTLERLSTIVRRYLGRKVGGDLTTLTTAELVTRHMDDSASAMFVAGFFRPADLVRFGGVVAAVHDIEPLYHLACAYVRTREQVLNPVEPPAAGEGGGGVGHDFSAVYP